MTRHPKCGDVTPETLSQLMDGEWQDIDRSACVAGLCGDEALRARWARLHLARDAMKGEAVLTDLSLADRIRSAIDDEPSYSNVVGFGASVDAAPTLFVPGIPAAAAVESATRAANRAATRTAGRMVTGDSTAGDGGNATEPMPAANRSTQRPRWRQAATGFGLAATVALATVAGLSIWQGAPVTGDDTSVRVAAADGSEEDTASLADPAAAPVVVGGVQTVVPLRLPEVELVGNRGSYWVSDTANGGEVRSAGEMRLNRFLARHLEQASSTSREGLLPYSRLVGYDETGALQQR